METEGYVVNAQDDYDDSEPLTELRTLEDVADLMLGLSVTDRLPLMHGEVRNMYDDTILEDLNNRIMRSVFEIAYQCGCSDDDVIRPYVERTLGRLAVLMNQCVRISFECALNVCGFKLSDILPGEE